MKKIFAILLLVGLAGCNTISGIGQDVQKGGEKVQELAKDVQRKI